MENFFDVATKEELKNIYGNWITDRDIKFFRELMGDSLDSNYGKLCELYFIRKDMEKARFYLNKIKDKEYKRGIDALTFSFDIID